MRAQPIDQRLPAEDDAGLWSAEQLVAAHGHEVHAGGERGLHGRLPRRCRVEIARAEVFDDRDAGLVGRGHDGRERRLFREALDAEVGRMHPEHERRRRTHRCREVRQARAVGRAHLAQQRAGLHHHVGHPEPAADLDQLAA